MSSNALAATELAARLARVPRAPGPHQGQGWALAVARRLIEGELTFDEALEQDAAECVAELVNTDDEGCSSEGARRCTRLDLPAVAAPVAAW